MPSAKWLQKGHSSFRNTHSLDQEVPSLCKASKDWARATQVHCGLVLDVPGQTHSSHN